MAFIFLAVAICCMSLENPKYMSALHSLQKNTTFSPKLAGFPWSVENHTTNGKLRPPPHVAHFPHPWQRPYALSCSHKIMGHYPQKSRRHLRRARFITKEPRRLGRR